MAGSEIMIVAGEASSDRLAANLVRTIRRLNPAWSFFGFGGPDMAAAGVDRFGDIHDLNVMGFSEVAPAAGRIFKLWRDLRRHLKTRRPEALILIDFPEFTLPLAKVARKLGITVIYYVPPQVWAWRTWRVNKLRDRTDRIITIFPFESEFYRDNAVDVYFAGHPLADEPVIGAGEQAAFLREIGLNPENRPVALLPGSRKNEISYLLPILAEAARRLKERRPDVAFLVPAAPGADRARLEQALAPVGGKVVAGRAREVLASSRAGWICSGTATLEAAWCNLPALVFYRGSFMSYVIAGVIIGSVEHFGLANLVAGKRMYPELLQYRLTPEALVSGIEPLLDETEKRRNMLADLARLKTKLGRPGGVFRAAREVIKTVGATI